MSVLAALAAGFAIGSVPSGFLLVRVARGQDIRSVGSGNIGATNVGRVLGVGGAVVTLLLDAAKGAAAVVGAGYLAPGAPHIAAAAGVGAILGHCFTPWLGFRGGKGVATMLGTFLVLAPLAVVAVMVTFAAVLGIWRFVSLASLAGAAMLPLATWAIGEPPGVIVAALLTLGVVALRHRDNARRLLRGTELRLGARAA